MKLYDVLRQIRLNNKSGSEREHFNAFYAAVAGKPDLVKEALTVWFRANYGKYTVEKVKHGVAYVPRVVQQPLEAEIKNATDKVEARKVAVQSIARNVLLDFTMVNGKPLRHATFADCARTGGWLVAVSKLGKGNEVVGRKLTEEDLQKVWKRHA